MAEFSVPVVRIAAIASNPSADAIELAVVGDYRSVVRKDTFNAADLAVYIPEGSVLPDWLLQRMRLWNGNRGRGRLTAAEGNRVKAIKLRGQLSKGLLLEMEQPGPTLGRLNPARGHGRLTLENGSDLFSEDEVAAYLGITKWEPPLLRSMGGNGRGAPDMSKLVLVPGTVPTYGLENRKKYPGLIPEGEEVVYTEKIHGSNLSFGYVPGLNHPDLFFGGDVYVGSKGLVAKGLLFRNGEAAADTIFVRAVLATIYTDDVYPGPDMPAAYFIGACQRLYPDQPVHVKAEVYGKGVQDLTYGEQGLRVKAFDAYVGRPGQGRWLGFEEKMRFFREAGIHPVDVLYRGPHDLAEMARHRDGKTVTGNGYHIREGIVITPVTERSERRFGLVILKEVSEAYLLRKGDVTEYA